MKTKNIRFIAVLAAFVLLIGILSPITNASAKTIKEGSEEYKKIEKSTGWIIFQVIYNLFDNPSGDYHEGKTSYKFTKDDYKTVLLSYLIDGNKDLYTKKELKQLSKDLFGKSYIDADFLSNLTKKGKKYWVMLGDYGDVEYDPENITITKKKGYIYISGDFKALSYEGDVRPLGKMTFKFLESGDNYVLKGATFTPAK